MPVHNALLHLDQAIESILAQSFSDFEFVILDDASTDGSAERLREWAAMDTRIRLLEVQKNLGPALSSDRVARAASAPIIARMDADDISYPNRLAEQFDLLSQHPEAGVVASLCDIIASDGRMLRQPEMWRLTRRSWHVPFAHGAMMYRKSLYDQVGGYRQPCVFWEDQDLVTRMAMASKVLVIPHALYQVRQSASSTRFTSAQQRLEDSFDLMFRCLDRLEHTGSYDELLESALAPPNKLDPRIYISLGSVILWAGKRPRLFRRLLERGRLRPDFRSLSALAWTAWASLSPGTLRPFLLFLLAARNRYAVSTAGMKDPVFWTQPSPNLSEKAADRGEAPSAQKAK